MIPALQNKIRILEQENSELKQELQDYKEKVKGTCLCGCHNCNQCYVKIANDEIKIVGWNTPERRKSGVKLK